MQPMSLETVQLFTSDVKSVLLSCGYI